MVLGQLDIHMRKNGVGPLPYSVCKKKLTQIKDLNVRPKNIKLLEGNIAANLRDPLPIFNWVIYLFIIQLQEFFIYARYKSLFSA